MVVLIMVVIIIFTGEKFVQGRRRGRRELITC